MASSALRLRLASIPIALILIGCGGGGLEPGNRDKSPFEFAFEDATADTLPPAPELPEGTGSAADLVAIRGNVSSNEIVLTLEFAEAIAPWSAGLPNSLDGVIDLDVDDDVSTGIADLAGGGIGADFYLDLRDLSPGQVALVNTVKRSFTTVSARFDATSVTITIPRSRFEGDDGEFSLTAVVGVPGRPRTDQAPNAGKLSARAPDAS